MLVDNRLGAESFQYRCFEAVYRNINTEVAAEQTIGQQVDAAYNTLTGRNITPEVLEQFAVANIHYGHRPSLIEAPVSEYPSLCVFSYRTSPSGQSTDSTSKSNIQVAIECIVKSDGYRDTDRSGVGEEQVGRRIKRTAEAINNVMQKHGATQAYSVPPPVVVWGEIFARSEEAGSGQVYYWQGVRMEYVFQKQNVETFAPDIDQAGF